ncbi:MAG: NADH:flavin oxidoreductase/NADH oxidase [Bacteroidetes bacterium]|jgi:2,4-dienoyl-CoA reductase-like NADH-dependent reductase (Old Yellow Enzyme family)|nr:NADH:flavin oxidoreductase/NADH oxidase [Bacteroidota bacterium]
MLHTPLRIKSVTLPNRIVMSPMCQYSSTDGYANEWHLVHYGTRAVGGTGLIILEATAVTPEGRITPYDLGIWSDNHIAELKKITSFIDAQGAVAGIQIAHAGRKASHDSPANGGRQLLPGKGGWVTVAPSAIPFDQGELAPVELDLAGIKTVIALFKEAAVRSLQAGFKVLEIHAAHGYLIQEFLSPLSNKRTDEYGGSFDNRTRLLLEVTEAVRSVWPVEFPLFVRLTATEWTDGGWMPEDTIRLSILLREKGVDLIDCSSGGNVPNARIPLEPGYQVKFSESVKASGIMTSAVGLITQESQIEEILEAGKADLVMLGRELLRNPYFVMNTKNATTPLQYIRGKRV